MGDRLRSRALLVLLTVASSATLAAQTSRSPTEFSAELRRLARDLATASPQAAREIDKTVPAVWSVEHRSRRYDVPAGALKTTMRSGDADATRWSSERAIIVERLQALAREAENLAASGEGVPASDATTALTRVLADPEFARLHRQSAMAQLWQRLTDWFAGILRRLGLGRVARAATAEAIAWAVSLAAVGALVVWLVALLRRPLGRTRLPSEGPSLPAMSAREWARRAASVEDIRDVVRCAYRAATCRLEDEGVWRVDDTRTPREYLRLLPEDHRRHRPIADIARRFEEICYGAREATPDDRRTLLGRLRELECLPAE